MQPDLSDITRNYHRGNAQSVKANAVAHKISARLRILEKLYDHSHGCCDGLTCEELEEFSGISHQSCSARLSELRREDKIKIVGERKTKSGCLASVYQII